MKKILNNISKIIKERAVLRTLIRKLILEDSNASYINKTDNSKEKIIKDFIIKCKKDLGINKLPKITIINDKNWVKNNKSFGSYNPINKSIIIYLGDRNLADFLRTLSHELTHHWQNENGRIKKLSGETGSDIENEANAKAGILLRNYGKENEMIYENKKIVSL
jgi:Zn-dependent peptidase ImmA (M78 family)